MPCFFSAEKAFSVDSAEVLRQSATTAVSGKKSGQYEFLMKIVSWIDYKPVKPNLSREHNKRTPPSMGTSSELLITVGHRTKSDLTLPPVYFLHSDIIT